MSGQVLTSSTCYRQYSNRYDLYLYPQEVPTASGGWAPVGRVVGPLVNIITKRRMSQLDLANGIHKWTIYSELKK